MTQDQLNAAVQAAIQYVTANPVAGVNISQASSTFHMLQTIRKFDGSYSAAIWIADFDQERTTYTLNETWAIRNLDRVLSGTAATWWKSRRASYVARCVNANPDPDVAYKEVCDAMKLFFSEESVKERARLSNEGIKFAPHMDPCEYVAKKVDCLVKMNPNMPPKEQVMHLLVGLPENIRLLVSPGDVDSVDKFTSKLTTQLALHRRSLESGQSSSRPDFRISGTFSSKSRQSKGKKKPMTSIPGLTLPFYSDEEKAASVDAEGNRLCLNCKKKGHKVNTCFALARKQGIEIPGLSKKTDKKSGN